MLRLDGVCFIGADVVPKFVAAPGLRDTDVREIVETTAGRVVLLLQPPGLLAEGSIDPLLESDPLLRSTGSSLSEPCLVRCSSFLR